MSAGAIFIICAVGMFPALILVALAVKLWEVHQASTWPSADGVVIDSKVESTVNRPGDPGYDFHDTEVSNSPSIVYEYTVGGRKYRASRITIAEKISDSELMATLARYPLGARVEVYYNPQKPEQTYLERELPPGVFWGMAVVLLFFIGGPILIALAYHFGVDWLRAHMPRPRNAPFVAALSVFASMALLFSLAFWRWTRGARKWPTTSGKIIESGVDAYTSLANSTSYVTYQTRLHYTSRVVYAYEVRGRRFLGDRVILGVQVSATLPGYAQRVANRYPVGATVQVYYNPQAPGESTLNPDSAWSYVLWILCAGLIATIVMIATR